MTAETTIPLKKENLIIFDFDHTIIDKNTDQEIINAQSLLGKCISAKNYFQNNVGWAESMTYTLKDLHGSNVSKEQIDKIILDIPLTYGMNELFNTLRSHKEKHDCIMLSHSNTYFIDLLLKKHGIEDCFDSIHTYHCEWQGEKGPLLVKPYDSLSVYCKICPPDFCKGVFVETHREKSEWIRGLPYQSVIYVGDGRADFCAATALKESDHVLARSKYPLHKRILNDQGENIKSKIFQWENGLDIKQYLLSFFDKS